VIVFNERHLLRLLGGFVDDYYHPARCHRSLDGNAPQPRSIRPPVRGKVISVPVAGGLHQVYRRAG
jgi:hypothetical protein